MKPDSDFNPKDPSTWPLALSTRHIAAIYGKSVSAIQKANELHRFRPAPHKRGPYEWRKVDVVRDLGLGEPMTLKKAV